MPCMPRKWTPQKAAFAPQQAKMVFAALITAFERSHCMPAFFWDRRSSNLGSRSYASAIPGALTVLRTAIEGGMEAALRCAGAFTDGQEVGDAGQHHRWARYHRERGVLCAVVRRRGVLSWMALAPRSIASSPPSIAARCTVKRPEWRWRTSGRANWKISVSGRRPARSAIARTP